MVVNLTRERLLNGARSTIRSRGYSDASVDDFARAAGLTKGAVYSQFDRKTDLLLAVVDQWAEGVIARLRRGRSRQLAAVTDFVFADLQGEWGEILPDLWRQAVDDAAVREHLVGAYHRIESALVAQLISTLPAKEAAAAAFAAISLHAGFIAQAALGAPRSSRASRAEVEQFLAAADAPPPRRRDARTG
jgi:AcrR family transcriptional regulator